MGKYHRPDLGTQEGPSWLYRYPLPPSSHDENNDNLTVSWFEADRRRFGSDIPPPKIKSTKVLIWIWEIYPTRKNSNTRRPGGGRLWCTSAGTMAWLGRAMGNSKAQCKLLWLFFGQIFFVQIWPWGVCWDFGELMQHTQRQQTNIPQVYFLASFAMFVFKDYKGNTFHTETQLASTYLPGPVELWMTLQVIDLYRIHLQLFKKIMIGLLIWSMDESVYYELNANTQIFLKTFQVFPKPRFIRMKSWQKRSQELLVHALYRQTSKNILCSLGTFSPENKFYLL